MRLKVKLFVFTLLLVAGGTVATALANKGDAPPLGGAMRQFILQTPPAPAPDVAFSDGADATLGFKDFKGKVGGWKYAESPVVDGDRLLVTPGGKDNTIVALNKKTGEHLAQWNL